ncbi:MAG TPA: hypothetical protein VMT53_25760 [Terriglobales bacterium]|nr:hypothetical protein [Terriglobales bacterium]
MPGAVAVLSPKTRRRLSYRDDRRHVLTALVAALMAEPEVTNAVAEITGRPAIEFSQFVRDDRTVLSGT